MKTLTNIQVERRNRAFWKDFSPICHDRIQNAGLLAMALATLRNEENRGVPTRYRLTLEDALAKAYERRADDRVQIGRAAAELGRKGGKAPRTDPLQRLILQIVGDRPEITCPQLHAELRRNAEARLTVIEVTSAKITYEDLKGREFDAPVSGLKDRLSRAKRRLSSR